MFKILLFITSIFILFSCSNNELVIKENIRKNENNNNLEKVIKKEVVQKQQLFISDNLSTDTSKRSIELSKVLDGGPGKNGIPAINNPKFIKISEVGEKMPYLKELSYGITVTLKGEAKFYPYHILVWHEIVNDTIGKKKISVTFCPLCGSAIVFDRIVDGIEVKFGVSGKLYESNLLMFDNITESLWSQSEGEAVVGEYLGKELEIVKSNLLTLKQFKDKYKSGLILSDNTGYNRNYGVIPYGDYNTNELLYFPVSNEDIRLEKKEILYVINDKENNNSLAFVLKNLIKEKKLL